MSTNDPLRPLCSQQGLVTMRLDEAVNLIDQRALPVEETWLRLNTVEDVADAIVTLAVRGAPAIGGAAALCMAMVARTYDGASTDELTAALDAADSTLRVTRPTAVNLFVALDQVKAAVSRAQEGGVAAIRAAVVDAAEAYCTGDAAACMAMGEHGAALFEDGDKVLTVCHTGALATCGIGTALGVLRTAKEQGKSIEVFALETRPLLQGSRLTAWECMKLGLKVTLVTDGMAAFALARKGITKAISGADRIAANGDTANKIGTYGLASLCKAHDVPFYVAAPSTTFDVSLAEGAEIPIEERNPDEIRRPRGAQFAPADVKVWNPAFDVTPCSLIAGIVTERGVWEPPFTVDARKGLVGG